MINEGSPDLAAVRAAAPFGAQQGDGRPSRTRAQRWRRGLLALGFAVALAASLLGQSGARAAGTSPSSSPSPATTSAGQTQGGTGAPSGGVAAASGPLTAAPTSGPSQPVKPTSSPSLNAKPTTVTLSSCQATGQTTLTWDTGTPKFTTANITVDNKNGVNQAVYTIPATQQTGSTTATVLEGTNTFKLTEDGSVVASAVVQGQCVVVPPGPCAVVQNCGPLVPHDPCAITQNCGNNGLPTPAQPLVLQPTMLLTSLNSYAGWSDSWYCFGGGPFSTAPLDPNSLTAQGQLAFGYDDTYDAGTNPMPCPYGYGYIYRGGVGFDMGQAGQFIQAHGLKSGVLQFSDVQGGLNCIGLVVAAGDHWQSLPSNVTVLPDSGLNVVTGGLSSPSVDVTTALLFGSGNPDLHFVFVGTNENTGTKGPSSSLSEPQAGSCLTTLGNFSLTLTPAH